MKMAASPHTRSVEANVDLERSGSLKELQVKFRLPKQNSLHKATTNGRPAMIGGSHNDSVIIQTHSERLFEIAVEYT